MEVVGVVVAIAIGIVLFFAICALLAWGGYYVFLATWHSLDWIATQSWRLLTWPVRWTWHRLVAGRANGRSRRA